MLKKRWSIAPVAPPSQFTRLSEYSTLVAQIFFNRGITDPDVARRFISGDAEDADPFLMLGMDTAVDRLRHAIASGEAIAVYGDFDADGVCSTALLTQTLQSVGAQVRPYIPHRMNEGYGLNKEALVELREKGACVVVTVDCGIRSLQEVEDGTSLGLDMIVTDHHSVGAVLPRCCAVVNPKQAHDPYPFKDFAGVGIAFKLSQAILRCERSPSSPHARPVTEDQLVDLVALGTVADLVPLTGENRSLVSRGLNRLNATERPGLIALMQLAGSRAGKIDASSIGYFLGPRLNAAGRIDTARTAYRLLMTQYPGEAEQLAAELEATNRERQRLTEEMVTKAREEVAALPPQELILFAGAAEFPEGVIGLIAGKLQEENYRPAIALSYKEEVMRGSARSIPEFNIVAALDECAELLVRHGGHAAAAGFTVENRNYQALHARLRAIAQRELGHTELAPTIAIDAEASLNEMNWQTLEALEKLAPFGYGNREPIFLTRRAIVRSARIVGTEHLSLILTDGTVVWDAIAFRQKDFYGLLNSLPQTVDVVYSLAARTYQGESRLQLEVKDLRISEF